MARAKSQRLRIPTIGDVLTLAQDWTFTCVAEHRNDKLMEHLESTGVIPKDAPRYLPAPERCGQVIERLGTACWRARGHTGLCLPYQDDRREYARYACTLPAGTRLRVDRIYIRKGASAYDSLTFWALDLSTKRVRFWARLSEVNEMVVAADGDATPKPKAKAAVELPPLRAVILRE